MLELVRKGNEVFCGEKKLTIVAQATKGPGKEVVKIDGLEGSNGQKWIALSKLKEGENQIECQGREVSISTKDYELTEEEAKKVKELKAEIDQIIENAKSRYVKKPKLLNQSEIAKMSQSQKDEYAEQLMKYIESLKA